MITISQLYIYPIKSCAGIRLDRSTLTVKGLALDRRWLLVDENGVHVTQRTNPEMVHFVPEISSNSIKVNFFDKHIEFPLRPNTENLTQVDVWGDKFDAIEVDTSVSKWFSEQLGSAVRLMFQPDESIRKIDPKYAVLDNDQVSAADGYPVLIISEESLHDLNTRLHEPVEMLRFRPNIVVKGMEPYGEDLLQNISVGDVALKGVKNCGRCIMVTNDLTTGTLGKEPLSTLAGYRKEGNKIIFGRNFIPQKLGLIKVGDVVVTE